MPDLDDTLTATGGTRWQLLDATGHVVRGDDVGVSFPVTRRPVVLGTGEGCDVRLSDGSVSKRHLELALVGAAVRVRDLGSTNGTFVGATRVVESLVPTGSLVRIGRTTLHLRGDDAEIVLEPSDAEGFGGLRGTSVAMRQLYAVLARVAPRDVTVFLDGETGTGKELAARAIHAASARSRGPFVVLDCSAVAPELLEAQLFGHARGAFTGAVAERKGVFEAAHGGTLFLDELDSLPSELQPKLLRALEGRAVVRVGEAHERPVDVRVVAASGRSPEDLASDGTLRRDLYFRLAVVRLTLPRLADRVDDVPVLAEHILAGLGSAVVVGPGSNLDRLRKYAWPGNVRELRNVLERAVTLAPPGARTLDDLPIRLAPTRLASAPDLHLELPYKAAKEAVTATWERAYLQAAFERSGGNLSATAREVGLTRLHLRRLLRRHGLVEDADD